MAYYARYYSELPTTFAKARNASKGDLRKFDTLVEARRFATKLIANGGVVLIYSANVDKWAYAINNPLQNPQLLGFVENNKAMGWYYWNIPDGKDRFTGEVYFKSRPIYPNGKMAGRF